MDETLQFIIRSQLLSYVQQQKGSERKKPKSILSTSDHVLTGCRESELFFFFFKANSNSTEIISKKCHCS